jgi:hypothetical protein
MDDRPEHPHSLRFEMGAFKEAARKDPNGDTRLGHLSKGDIVILRSILYGLGKLHLKRPGVEAPREMAARAAFAPNGIKFEHDTFFRLGDWLI